MEALPGSKTRFRRSTRPLNFQLEYRYQNWFRPYAPIRYLKGSKNHKKHYEKILKYKINTMDQLD